MENFIMAQVPYLIYDICEEIESPFGRAKDQESGDIM